MVDIIHHQINIYCNFDKKLGGLTGHPKLQAGELLVESKHLDPPPYLCTMHR